MPPVTNTYEAVPFRPRPETLSTILRGVAASDGHFCRFDGVTCLIDPDRPCYLDAPLETMCDACKRRLLIVSASLTQPDMRAWEIWTDGSEPALVGIALLSEIQPGIDATAHYIFFDRDLRGKTPILLSLIDWAFTDGPEWEALQHITIEIPFPAFALARHASRKLGFGGPYTLNYAGKRLAVSGVKRNGTRWNGTPTDLLILGRHRNGK
jgi:hypothetical protein